MVREELEVVFYDYDVLRDPMTLDLRFYVLPNDTRPDLGRLVMPDMWAWRNELWRACHRRYPSTDRLYGPWEQILEDCMDLSMMARVIYDPRRIDLLLPLASQLRAT